MKVFLSETELNNLKDKSFAELEVLIHELHNENNKLRDENDELNQLNYELGQDVYDLESKINPYPLEINAKKMQDWHFKNHTKSAARVTHCEKEECRIYVEAVNLALNT